MLSFSSPLYYLFLILSLVGYYALPNYQKQILIFSGAIFIASFSPLALPLFIIMQGISYTCALQINHTKTGPKRKILFSTGIALLASIAILQKFIFPENITFYTSHESTIFVGISFLSLQCIAYLIDVYFRQIEASTNIWNFTTYGIFFPKWVSGPIMHWKDFNLQNAETKKCLRQNIEYGIQRILLGLFKKLVIADRLSAGVSSIFDFQDEIAGVTKVVAAFLFLIQLYFDFSAYVDIAIGSARMFNIYVPENFNMPLRAKSISEFWRRWHISLVNWLTQYIYYPTYYSLRKNIVIGGILSIFLTLMVSGIWHGISLTFMTYSILHAMYLIAEFILRKNKKNITSKIPKRVKNISGNILTLSLVSFSMIFFRSSSWTQALWYIKSTMHVSTFFPKSILKEFLAPLAVGGHQEDLFNFYICIFFAATYLLLEHKITFTKDFKRFNFVLAFACILFISIFGVLGNHARFIYMQF